jgi:DNA polymerase III delta prime subunit
MASTEYLLHYWRRLQSNHFDINVLLSGDKGSGKSTAALYLTIDYLDKFSFICPKCGNRFYKNLYSVINEGNKNRFVIPHYILDGKAWIKCPEEYMLDMKTGQRKLTSGCGYEFLYSQRKKIKFEASKYVAYDNKDVVDKLYNSPQHSPIVVDEAMGVLAAMNHNKIEAKYLKNLLTVIRPKRYIIFYLIPEASWLDSKVREGFTSFWLRILERGTGVLFEKDKGETMDKYHVKEMAETMGTIKYFTDMKRIEKNLQKHPCYFDTFRFRELDAKVYDEYEMVRNAMTLQRQVEEMQLSNKDMAKIMAYHLIRNWDRIKVAVDRTRDFKMSYEILVREALSDPVTRSAIISDVTARNWVRGVEEYITSKGKNAGMFEGQEGKIVQG